MLNNGLLHEQTIFCQSSNRFGYFPWEMSVWAVFSHLLSVVRSRQGSKQIITSVLFMHSYLMSHRKHCEIYIKPCLSFWIAGLLRGDSVSNRDRHPGSPYPPDPSVVSEGHLPARICPQRPGLDEGQVSKGTGCHFCIRINQYILKTCIVASKNVL